MITSCPYWNMIYDRYVYYISIHIFESLKCILLIRIDKSCFYELFLHNAIYVPLSDDTNCYVQITGTFM